MAQGRPRGCRPREAIERAATHLPSSLQYRLARTRGASRQYVLGKIQTSLISFLSPQLVRKRLGEFFNYFLRRVLLVQFAEQQARLRHLRHVSNGALANSSGSRHEIIEVEIKMSTEDLQDIFCRNPAIIFDIAEIRWGNPNSACEF